MVEKYVQMYLSPKTVWKTHWILDFYRQQHIDKWKTTTLGASLHKLVCVCGGGGGGAKKKEKKEKKKGGGDTFF